MTRISLRVALVVTGLVAALGASGRTGDSASRDTAQLPELKRLYQRPTSIPYPADNAYTLDRERLGRMLFFDPRLSGSNFISCATCHSPAFSWTDPLPRAIGHGMKSLARRTPTILNLAWAMLLFWDGRSDSLEAQALGPIASPDEMNQDLGELVAKLSAIEGYRVLFALAYPGEGLTAQTIAKALAVFERGVVSGVAPFDEWIAGRNDAIQEAAKRGFLIFNTKGRCAKCHAGWAFTDFGFHDIGMDSPDPGRGKQLPGIVGMQHAFKTPTLRNVAQRAPYMHDGSLPTLSAAIEFYDKGGTPRPSRSPEMDRLGLTEGEKSDLIEFLKTLTSAGPVVSVPDLPR
jgi:cytochrome c peroxidase